MAIWLQQVKFSSIPTSSITSSTNIQGSLLNCFLQYSSQTWSLFLCLAFSCVCGALPDSSLPYHVFHHHSGSVLECCTPGVFFVISLLSTLSPTTVSSTQQTERSFYNLSQITLFLCSKLPPIALSVSLRIGAKVIIEIKNGPMCSSMDSLTVQLPFPFSLALFHHPDLLAALLCPRQATSLEP